MDTELIIKIKSLYGYLWGAAGWQNRRVSRTLCRTKTNIEHLSLLLSTFSYFVGQGLSPNMQLICLLGGMWESSCFCPPWPPSKAGGLQTRDLHSKGQTRVLSSYFCTGTSPTE